MISRFLYALESALRYTKNHPQIYLGLIIVIVIPLVFLYTGQQFLDAGRLNQDRLQKEKVGLLHDAFSSLVRTNHDNAELLNAEISHIARVNPDIKQFRVVQHVDNEFVPVAALATTTVGIAEKNPDLFQSAAVRLDESLIFEFYIENNRVWQGYRTVELESGDLFFVFTEHDLSQIDAVLAQAEREAYGTLIVIYIIVLLIAFWLIRNTDYQHLYLEAKNAVKTKDLFTNMIAHELRAPLTAIRGYASMMEEKKDLSKDERQYVVRIRQSSERLLTIVNDLLDVARIQSGKLSVENKEVDVSVVINAVVDELRISASEKNITLATTGSDSTHLAVADQKRLHQALTNIVSNSIKYTKEGQIEVSVEIKASKLEVRVMDTGMGISAEEKQKLFAPFYRVQSNDVSAITGTGLGMWITKQLIELMGASIAVESIKGVGTHIVITLPTKLAK